MLELGQVVEIELVRIGVRVRASTFQLVEAHIWFELHTPTHVAVGDRIKLEGLEALITEVREPALVKVAVQRREYFRVPATLPVTLSVTTPRNAKRATGDLIAVTTVDLSGGGVQLETDHALEVGDTLELSLALPARLVHVSGTVTRVAPAEQGPLRIAGREHVRLVGVELGPMMERDRAELVRFVHDVERRLRSLRDV